MLQMCMGFRFRIYDSTNDIMHVVYALGNKTCNSLKGSNTD